MSLPLRTTILLLLATLTSSSLWGQPPAGSQLPPEDNGCALCHGEASLWQGEKARLHVSPQQMAKDVHATRGVNCHDCHGGNPGTLEVSQAHNTNVRAGDGLTPFRNTLAEIWADCGDCHSRQQVQLDQSVHAGGDNLTTNGLDTTLGCDRCHGTKAHGMRPVADIRSPVHLENQLIVCGECHAEDVTSYYSTVHGLALLEGGLNLTAVCADCHGAHGIHPASDERSSLHATKVSATCGECHEGIGSLLESSIHGSAPLVDSLPGDSDVNESSTRNPSCNDCHPGHRMLKTSSDKYRGQIAGYCGGCHSEMTDSYLMSTHGRLTQLGHGPAAKCSDCHGAHQVLAIDDPRSSLAPGENRLQTCRSCHENAVVNFSKFDPHADYRNAEQYPKLHSIYLLTRWVFFGFVAFFVIHTILWFLRSFATVMATGRHRTLVANEHGIERYTRGNRVVYMILLLCFLGLMATGLPMRYSSQQWAREYVVYLGGFEYISMWHHLFAAVALFCGALHFVLVAGTIVVRRRRAESWRRILMGSDSPVPTMRDARDLTSMVRWFLGLGPKPGFERWTYWEKYDYWMACLAFLVIGLSGLMLWYPNLFCLFLSGTSLNVARLIHVELALLIASFLFIFHVFHSHLRPEKFPMDLSAITGVVSEEHLRAQRPDLVARLEAEGQLAELRRPTPSKPGLWFTFLIVTTLFATGIGLLTVAVVATLGG
jgi:cytochrome b subunit of formate dehydrogenase